MEREGASDGEVYGEKDGEMEVKGRVDCLY